MSTATITETESSTEPAASASPPIIFFDGVCGLCNRFVDFVMKRDRKGVFRFATIQGEVGAEKLPDSDTATIKSMVVQINGKNYRRSSGVVRVLWRLGWFWKILGALFWLIPFPLRDLFYAGVAKMRYKFFGKKDICRMPTPEERARFLG